MVRIRDGLYVQIVRFYLENGHAEKLAEKVSTHLQGWICECKGFVSASLHVSDDGKHLINYLQWQDEECFQAFLKDNNQDKLMLDIESVGPDRADSDPFELYIQQSIEDKFWSKTHI